MDDPFSPDSRFDIWTTAVKFSLYYRYHATERDPPLAANICSFHIFLKLPVTVGWSPTLGDCRTAPAAPPRVRPAFNVCGEDCGPPPVGCRM